MLLVLVLAGYSAYTEYKFRSLSEDLDSEIATYKRQHWERPVLRGQPGEGNAAFEAQQALQGFTGIAEQERDALAAQLFYGNAPLPAAQVALVDKHIEMIAKLRAATQLGWAMTELPVERGEAMPLPQYPLVIDAALLALGHAARSSADDCLVIGADVVRMGQDLIPGATLEAASISTRITSLAAPVIARCASEASTDAILRAARELNLMATHAAPTGGGVELADMLAQVQLRHMCELPAPEGDSTFMRLRRRPALFEAWTHFLGPTRWRELTPDKYPAALETWQHEHEWRSRSELALVADVTAHVQTWLYEDMRGQALLRTLSVGVATLAERSRRGRTPREPVTLNEPALVDPYNGQALKWRITQDGTELSIWSVGEDRRDDKGSSDWTTQAPIDVVVHFRLRPLASEEPLKHAPPPQHRAAVP